MMTSDVKIGGKCKHLKYFGSSITKVYREWRQVKFITVNSFQQEQSGDRISSQSDVLSEEQAEELPVNVTYQGNQDIIRSSLYIHSCTRSTC